MACRLLSSSPSYGQIAAEVDRIIINTDLPKVELQVANTMETNLPINWVYEKGGAEGNDELVIVQSSRALAIAARRYGAAVTLTLDEVTGKLRWTYVGQPEGNYTYLFACRL